MSDNHIRIISAVAGVVFLICVIALICYLCRLKSSNFRKTTLDSLRKLKSSPLPPTRGKLSQNYDIESNEDSSVNLHVYSNSSSSDNLKVLHDTDMMTSPRINAILDQVMETSSKLLRSMSTQQEDHVYEQVPLNAPSKDF